MTTTTASWRDVFVQLAEVGTVEGCQFEGLPGFENREAIDPDRIYELGDSMLVELFADAVKLAESTCTEDANKDWVELSTNFHIELGAAVARDTPVPTLLRQLAWEIGMQADFAAGLFGK